MIILISINLPFVLNVTRSTTWSSCSNKNGTTHVWNFQMKPRTPSWTGSIIRRTYGSRTRISKCTETSNRPSGRYSSTWTFIETVGSSTEQGTEYGNINHGYRSWAEFFFPGRREFTGATRHRFWKGGASGVTIVRQRRPRSRGPSEFSRSP